MQFSVIGLAVAFSPTTEAMMAEAGRLVTQLKARLVLIHVGNHSADEDQQVETLIGSSAISREAIKVVWRHGNPVKEILTACEEEKIDLLLAGALKKENLVNHYLGTVARKIMHKANCSVLMITKPSLTNIPIKNIVVNAEDSPFINEAIYAACVLGSFHHSWIHIVRELKLLGLALAANEQCNEEEYNQRKQQMLQQEVEEVEDMLKIIPSPGSTAKSPPAGSRTRQPCRSSLCAPN